MLTSLFLNILMSPIVVDFYFNRPPNLKTLQSVHEGLKLVKNESGIKLVIGKVFVGKYNPKTWFTIDKTRRSVLYLNAKVPHGLAEVCANRAIVYAHNDLYENADLLKHELLHTLGASHYKGFIDSVNPQVMRSIKKCLK